MADVHRILGTLPAACRSHGDCRRKRKDPSQHLERALPAWWEVMPLMQTRKSWDLLARWFAEAQIRAIADAVMLVMSSCIATSAAPVIAAGIGVDVAAEVARRLGVSLKIRRALGGCSGSTRCGVVIAHRLRHLLLSLHKADDPSAMRNGMRLAVNLFWITCLIAGIVPCSSGELTRSEVQSILVPRRPAKVQASPECR